MAKTHFQLQKARLVDNDKINTGRQTLKYTNQIRDNFTSTNKRLLKKINLSTSIHGRITLLPIFNLTLMMPLMFPNKELLVNIPPIDYSMFNKKLSS